MGSLSEYDIDEPTSVLQRSDSWKNMSPEDRRRTAVEFYYTILGMCEKKAIKQCSKSDAKFIAKTVGLGDPQCFFYCGFEEMVVNAEKLPGIHTLELAMEIGVGWNDEVNTVDDMEALDTRGRQETGIGRLHVIFCKKLFMRSENTSARPVKKLRNCTISICLQQSVLARFHSLICMIFVWKR